MLENYSSMHDASRAQQRTMRMEPSTDPISREREPCSYCVLMVLKEGSTRGSGSATLSEKEKRSVFSKILDPGTLLVEWIYF